MVVVVVVETVVVVLLTVVVVVLAVVVVVLTVVLVTVVVTHCSHVAGHLIHHTNASNPSAAVPSAHSTSRVMPKHSLGSDTPLHVNGSAGLVVVVVEAVVVVVEAVVVVVLTVVVVVVEMQLPHRTGQNSLK